MSGVDKITSIVDIPAIQGELSTVSKGIADLVAQIQAVKKVGVEISGAKSATELSELNKQLQTNVNLTNQAATAAINESTALANLSKTTKDLTGTIDQNIKLQARYRIELQQISSEMKLLEKTTTNAEKTTGRYRNQVGELLKRQNELKQAQSEITASLKNQIKEQNAAGGSVDALRARYNLLIKTFDSLSDAERKSTAGQTIKLEAAGISNELKSLEGTTGRFQRNVGNYGNAIVETFKKGYSGLRTLANILPSFGISTAILLIANQASAAFDLLKRKLTETEETAKRLNAINEKATDGYIEQKTEIENLVSVIKNENTTNEQKKDILKLVNDKYGEQFGKLKDVNDLETTFVDKAGDFIRALTLKAKAQAAFGLAVENSKKEQEALYQLQTNTFNSGVIEQLAREGLININKGAKKAKDEFLKISNEINKELGELNKKSGFNFDKTGDKDKETIAKKSRDLAEANRKAVFDIQKEILAFTIETNKAIADDTTESLAVRLGAARAFYEASQDLIILNRDFEKAGSEKTKKELELIEIKSGYDLIRISKVFNGLRLKAKEDFDKAFHKDEEKLQEGLAKIAEKGYKQWKDIQDKQAADKKKQDEDDLKATEKLEDEKKKLRERLAQEITALAFTVLTANIENQKNAIQEQIDLLEAAKQKDIEVANQTIGNAQDRAAAITTIEARAAAQKEALQRKQRDLDIKKAQFDKAQSIARIVQETAIQIIKNVTSPLLPLIIGIGAAQLATVIATPIPRYKDGGEHKGGPMIVGDGGKSEGIVFPDGTTMKSPATDTLMTAPAGTVIYPDFNKMMLNSTMTKPVEFKAKAVSDTSIVKELKEVKKAINKIPQQNVTVANILSQRVRNGSGYNNHLRRES